MTQELRMARRVTRPLALAAVAMSLAGCMTAQAPVAKMADRDDERRVATATTTTVRPKILRSTRMASLRRFEGVASYYAEGKRVASGARYDPNGLTAAHPSLPFGTKLRVSDPKSGKSVVVTVNDRGPFVHGRVLDLSLGAARALGMESRGVNRVTAQVM